MAARRSTSVVGLLVSALGPNRRKDPTVCDNTLDEWRFRARSRAQLEAMSDRELADIGLTRDGALREADKPFWRR